MFSSPPGHLNHFQRIRTPQGLCLWQYKTILFFKIFQLDFLSLNFSGFWSRRNYHRFLLIFYWFPYILAPRQFRDRKTKKYTDKNSILKILENKIVLYCHKQSHWGVRILWKWCRWPGGPENLSKTMFFHEKSMDFMGFPCQNLLWTADTLTAPPRLPGLVQLTQ